MASHRSFRAVGPNSDGLLPTLVQLASANSLGVWLDLDRLTVPGHISEFGVNAARFWLGWGDWNVIVAMAPNGLDQAMQIVIDAGSVATPIGKFVAGKPELLLRRGDVMRVAPRLESERFAKDSWFGSGIQGYIDLLLSINLP